MHETALADRWRDIRGGDGNIWKVFERGPGSLHPDLGSSLIFDSGSVVRRIYAYPNNWFDLSDADLLALCAVVKLK
ncbi:MAG TPA: hypothetical protein VN706_16150 [Gemmatimonadaceae bacterium]|nr:hypothetical protein [Gemmatimonadaceae bacterium]